MKLTISELASKIIEELQKLNYSYNTVCKYRAFYKRFNSYAEAQGESYFYEELGKRYLKEQYGCTINYYLETSPKKLAEPIRFIRLLGDYQLHGIIVRRVVKKPGYVKPPQFEHILIAYEKECADNEYSVRGMRTRTQRLYFFIDYLALKGVQDVKEISPTIISNYIKTILPNHEKSIASILTTLRVFLRFLYQEKFTELDLSVHVPKQNRYYYPPVPSTWKPEEVKMMLDSIDRGNPKGKRDYAILLLVAKLGIRVGDLKSLKLVNLKWSTKTIEIIQEKTKVKATYPILKDIGWALIDYLKNGRPVCDSPYLFVRLNAPYTAFGENANLHHIITTYTREAGIKIPKGKRHGMHSLRHSLASTLLEKGTPLPIISEILGHIDSKSTSIYLRTDIEGLRACCIDPEKVFQNV